LAVAYETATASPVDAAAAGAAAADAVAGAVAGAEVLSCCARLGAMSVKAIQPALQKRANWRMGVTS